MHTTRFWLAGIMVVLLLAAVPGLSLGISVPDNVTLNSQSKIYEPFQFNHAKHIQLTKECSDCHHHTTGTLMQDPNCIRCHRNSGATQEVSCKGCHVADPFSAATLKSKDPKTYHIDKPGVKAAMHITCIGCHKKASGPTGCLDCHSRKKEGDALYNSGAYTPKHKPAKSGHGGGH